MDPLLEEQYTIETERTLLEDDEASLFKQNSQIEQDEKTQSNLAPKSAASDPTIEYAGSNQQTALNLPLIDAIDSDLRQDNTSKELERQTLGFSQEDQELYEFVTGLRRYMEQDSFNSLLVKIKIRT